MDIEFVLQDAYALVRPQWKLVTTLEEAGSAFAEACKENYKSSAADKLADADEREELDDENDVDGRRTPVGDEDGSSDDEADVSLSTVTPSDQLTSGRMLRMTSQLLHGPTLMTMKLLS